MKRWSTKIIFALLCIAVSCVSCVDEAGEIGNDLIASSDLLNSKDTVFSVTAYSVLDDSLTTSKYSPVLLGAYLDPNFGKSEANIVTQLIPDVSAAYTFPSSTSIDSVVLSIAYRNSSGIYPTTYSAGSDNPPVTLSVYELNTKLYKDSIYRSDSPFQYNSSVIGSVSFKPNLTDSTYGSPQLRIALSKTWAQKFLTADPSVYQSADNFTDFFKGLYIKATGGTSNSCITYMVLTSSATRLTLYYHTGTDTAQKKSSFQVDISNNKACTYFNQFLHNNYAGANPLLLSQINKTDISKGQQQLFLQTMGGVNIRLTMPQIPEWMKDKRVVINQASLILPVDLSSNTYDPISQLNVYKILSAGGYDLLPDHGVSSNIYAYLDGAYNTSAQTYRLRITRYFQRWVLGTETDNSLLIVADSRRTTANSSIIKGTSGNNPVRLEVIYTYR